MTSNYWTRRLSRREAIKSAASTAGALSAVAIVGCGSGSDKSATETPPGSVATGTTGTTPGPDKLATSSPVVQAPGADSLGGTLQINGFEPILLDRYDPHQTLFGPMKNIHSAVFSRVLKYDNLERQVLGTDLAQDVPEVVDGMEYVIKLRPEASFHDSDRISSHFPSLAGRQVTAEDVRYSFERQANSSSAQAAYYYEAGHYSLIDSIHVVDQTTLRVVTNGPVAPFLYFLADTSAFIIPQEIVDQEPGPSGEPWDSVDALPGRLPSPRDRMIGSGPFLFANLEFGNVAEFVRNHDWHGWGDDLQPYLDAFRIRVLPDRSPLVTPPPTPTPTPIPSLEEDFRNKRIDAISPSDYSLIEELKREFPEAHLRTPRSSSRVTFRFKIDVPPVQRSSSTQGASLGARSPQNARYNV